jgi:uncharacterized protein DUF4019
MHKSLLLPVIAVLGGCSAAKDEAGAEQAVGRFHQMLDAGRYAEMYDIAAPEMKSATPKASFVQLMETIHRKLGSVKRAKQQGWNVNYGTAGAIVRLSYQTDFAGGTGTEQFVFRAGPGPALVAYNINSTDLILK